MKTYLVGGAVRDQLLGYPIKERDWVVVGSTPEELKQQGYQQVGKDFPIFLHPQTREEYALARIERKNGPGYYGFHCDYQPSVTLEEDLFRRDLTINAMAMDEHGHLVDPYNGRADLDAKILRHVSNAFVEDPVRVLRVARFAARYHHLGFKIANETEALMREMVRAGELKHLVAERVWQELQSSLTEKNPEMFICVLRTCGGLYEILPELDVLFGVPSWRHYHPEIDSGVHTLMVLRAAVKLSENPLVRFIALVHDLGKGCTSKHIWPAQLNHDELGVAVIQRVCQRLRTPKQYQQMAVLMSKHHLNVHRLFELRSNTIVNLLEKTDAFRRPEQFDNLLLACEADAQAKYQTGEPHDLPWFFAPILEHHEIESYDQAKQWLVIAEQCRKINTEELVARDQCGIAIKQALHDARVNCVNQIKKKWEYHEK